MHILLTNDDGITAPGLLALYDELQSLGDITVVAPDSEKSAAAHSLTLRPIHCEKVNVDNKFHGYAVSGSPADCVKLALLEVCKDTVDLVVSGMNLGANVGVNICYSGTVAAALEAGLAGIPAFAVSTAWEENADFPLACRYALGVIRDLLPGHKNGVININVPRLSHGKPKGVRIAPQSGKGFNEFFALHSRQGDRHIYQINGGGHKDDPSLITDTNLLHEGYITVCALHSDFTDYERNRRLEHADFSNTLSTLGENNG